MNANPTLAERQTNTVHPAAAEAARRPAITPAVDIVEDHLGVTLRADLPGVPRENLDVKVHDNTLTIEADTRLDTPADLRVRHAEIRATRYARSFVLARISTRRGSTRTCATAC